MRNDEFLAHVESLLTGAREIMEAKGAEYANDDDRCENFKIAAELLGVDPLTVWAVYFFKHISSIMTFVKVGGDETKLSEPIEGRFQDAINYLVLGSALICDRRREPQPSAKYTCPRCSTIFEDAVYSSCPVCS